jgi:hypothetical protein
MTIGLITNAETTSSKTLAATIPRNRFALPGKRPTLNPDQSRFEIRKLCQRLISRGFGIR